MRGRLGHGLAARALTPLRACRRAGAWSPRVARAWDGVVARSLRGRWWLASGKVLPVSSRGPPGGRWATRVEAGLTEVVAR
jgi:hypothetical protein